ncbi:hypothetical protein DRQ53_00995 [bacterium]|nr:MAG: hypothetical protein DRQ32_03005 [bacterium]RKZ18309.1 MAG: hypothetical protein DRQ53_00995 [bacterium]
MRLSEQRIEAISRAITDRLAEDELVDLTIDEDDLADLVSEVITSELTLEDDIQREAVQWLEVNRKHLDTGSHAWQIELDKQREVISIRRGYKLP